MVIVYQLILFAALTPSWNAHAQSFDLKGSLVETIFLYGRLTETREFQFSMYVNGCECLISTTNSKTQQRVQVAIENGAMYTLWSDPFPMRNPLLPEHPGQIVTNANGIPEPNHVGSIHLTDIPDNAQNGVRELWLAYCSGCYFKQQTNGHLLPMYPLEDPTLRLRGFTVAAKWDLDLSPPFLPRGITYSNDGNYRLFTNGKHETVPAPAPFDKGYAHAIFRREASTNVGGFSFPSHFLFERDAIHQGKLVPRVIFEGVLESISATPPRLHPRPEFTTTASIADFRFALSNPPVAVVHFDAKNGRWPDVQDVMTNYLQTVRIMRLKPSGTALPSPGTLKPNPN